MSSTAYFEEKFDQAKRRDGNTSLHGAREKAFTIFNKRGIPAARDEEWKYTRIAPLFNREYQQSTGELSKADIDQLRIPGNENANELFFINGRFSSSHSVIRSEGLVVLPLEKAAETGYKEIVEKYLGHSNSYLKDGINALNLALTEDAVFIQVKKSVALEHPVYLYYITDSRDANIFAQPRSLLHVNTNAQVQFVETFITLGTQESFTSQVAEIVVEQDARVEYYKIQNDSSHTSQVNTTHIRQVGKSYTYIVTVSLDGSIVRNNTNVILEAEFSEAHLYGLYFQQGQSHIDNHTVVDNVKPNCLSNELYKGIMSDNSSGVFNGKIFVRADAQKTNAYQSNKNVLLSEGASVNTKPQLEIFADDVKCSHGCTIGRLDQEGLFYLQSRGIPEKTAKSLLLQGFAVDILEKIKLLPVRTYVEHLISQRLELI